jgi:tRNA A37 methylthiotransferase MiaB
MRRGYSREAYIGLIDRVREVLPGCAITSDFISGFCGETEEEHKDTLSLLEYVQYDQAFMFAYSLREKTPAHRKLQDDVPPEVKKRRLNEVIQTFKDQLRLKNTLEIGKKHLVLVEGSSRKSNEQLVGRSDTNKKVVFDPKPLPTLSDLMSNNADGDKAVAKVLDYVIVQVDAANGQTLTGRAIAKTSLQEYSKHKAYVDSIHVN